MATTSLTAPVIEIFKPGSHTTNSGASVSFSASDLQQTAAIYDPGTHDAPVVVGHPKDNAPAYGWVKGLRFDGQVLKAELSKVDPEFAEIVKAGRYRKVSASFYAPDNPQNPKPGSYYLRHVGFLGAHPPAVKGLKEVEFSDATHGVLDFGEPDPSAEVERLRAENERLRGALEFSEGEAKSVKRLQNEAFLNELVAKGKPLPAEKAGLLDFMDHLEGSGVLEFSEAGRAQVGAVDYFRSVLNGLPIQVDFSERAPGRPGDEDDGAEVHARRIKDHVEQELGKGRHISFSEAAREIE